MVAFRNSAEVSFITTDICSTGIDHNHSWGTVAVGALGVLGLLSAAGCAKSPSDAPQPYDYCTLNKEDADPFVRKKAGAKVELVTEILFKSDLDAIKALNITEDSLIHHEKDKNKYNVVLIPVGFDDPDKLTQTMESHTDLLSRLFQEIKVNISYLDQSVPLGVARTDRNGWLTDQKEADLLFQKLQSYGIDNLVIVFNSTEHIGAVQKYAVIACCGSCGVFGAGHEILHYLTVTDGYAMYYGPGLATTELFTSTQTMVPRTKMVYDEISPTLKIENTGNVCRGQPVYVASPYRNMMTEALPDDYILETLNNGGAVVTPLQVGIANKFIEQYVQTRK